MIKNYGLLWQRKYVHFGSGGKGKKGTLLGYHSSKGSVDFREQIGIYVLYDNDFVPVYVGQAGIGKGNLLSRLNSHTKSKDHHVWNRWEYFSWFGLKNVATNGSKLHGRFSADSKRSETGKTMLDEFEGILIASISPTLNKQGPKLSGAELYVQDIDDNIVDLSLGDIHNQISGLQKEVEKLKKARK